MWGRIENPYEVLEGVLAGVANPRDLPLAFLEDITEHFSEERKIGEGGFGTVYKGLLHNGEMVAVKKILRAIPSSQTQFENEVNLLMKLKHQNIVRLVGYCYETRHLHMPHEGRSVFAWDTESLLCLECLPNGSLDKYISDASSGLNWHTRYKIIEGISYGLQYLHEHSNEPIIHLDLKPANILLDAKMLPKITDFGLSRLFDQNQTMHTAITRGTLGYMSPEFLRGIITPMSDIFSLGVIIMEVITGHRDYPYDIRKYSEGFILFELQEWRNRLQKEPGYTSLETDCQQIERCIQIGLICVNPERTKRPTMKKIINLLEGFESMDWYISNESKGGLDIMPQTAYPQVESPISSPVQGRGDWSVLANKNLQVIPSEAAARNIDHDYRGRTILSSSKQYRNDVSAQASQHDSHAVEFDFDTRSQNPPFKGLSRSDVLDGSVGAEAQQVQETSAQWGSGDSPNLTSGLEEATPYLVTLPGEPGSSFSEAAEDDPFPAEDDPLPSIKDLQITGEAFPGRELQASGYSTDGTTSCNFQWAWHLDDGSVKFIEGARRPNYLVTANDVGTLLHIEIQPLDDRKRKGEVIKVYANDQEKITCDPETKELIKKTLEAGQVSYQVRLLQVRFLDMWEPAVLAIKREGYSIKCNGQHGVVLTEKFQQATAIRISPGYKRATEFVIVSADGHEYNLQPAENTPPRDTIVLVLRSFRNMSKSGLSFPSDVLDGSVGAEAQHVRETSAQWGSGDSPNLASGLEEANRSYPYLPMLPKDSGPSLEDDLLPGIEGLQITGEAFIGQELQAYGYSINGTTNCNFKWARRLDDGSIKYIEGAREPNYLVTADDVDTLLAIEVQPLDDRKRKGEVVKVFANNQEKITCDPETKELIKKTLETGQVSYQVQLPQVRFLDMWEPAVLAIKREGYSIKCNGQPGVVLAESFQQATAINISPGHERKTEFVIVSADGHEYNLQPAENTLPRDTIVLVLRLFRSMAVAKRRGRKKASFSSRSF